MCGISGILRPKGILEEILNIHLFLENLKSRGPDNKIL